MLIDQNWRWIVSTEIDTQIKSSPIEIIFINFAFIQFILQMEKRKSGISVSVFSLFLFK